MARADMGGCASIQIRSRSKALPWNACVGGSCLRKGTMFKISISCEAEPHGRIPRRSLRNEYLFEKSGNTCTVSGIRPYAVMMNRLTGRRDESASLRGCCIVGAESISARDVQITGISNLLYINDLKIREVGTDHKPKTGFFPIISREIEQIFLTIPDYTTSIQSFSIK